VRRLASRLICEDCGANAAVRETQVAAADKVVMPTAGGAAAETAAAVAAQTEPLRCRRCGGRLVQRTDDSAGVVLERLKVYDLNTKPLVEFYRRRPTFRTIDGAQPPDDVAAQLAAAIEAAGNGGRRRSSAVRHPSSSGCATPAG